MRIEFTVRGPAGSRDVAVSAAATTPVGEVLPALARLAGAGSVEPAWVGARRLAGTVGDCGLRPGVIVAFGEPPPSTRLVGLHAVHVVGGTRAGDPMPLPREGVTAGRDPGCDVVLRDDRASRRHATLRAGPSGVSVHDLGSTNGTTLDGVPVPPAGATVEPGALIRIGDSLLTVAAADPPPRAALMRGADGALQVNRAPRPRAASPAVVIDSGDTARSAPPGRVQWIAALLPAAAGGLLAWLLAAPLFLLFALLSPAMLLGTAAGDRLHWRRERRRADVLARRRRAVVDEQISAALRAETAARRTASPTPASLVDIAVLPGLRLWEREPGDPDHLGVRVGSADAVSAATVRRDGTTAAAGVVPSVPAVVDLRSGALGVAGTRTVVDDVARWVVSQLAVLHAPVELDIVVLGDSLAERWTWCRWLPHLRAAPSGHEAVATTLASLTALRDRRRDAAAAAGPPRAWTGRWSVVVADRLAGADAGALGTLLSGGPSYGITAICLADTAAELPAACRSVALADTASDCRVRLRRPAGDDVMVLADRVGAQWAEQVARSLAPLTDARSGVSLPAECRWGDLVRADDPDTVADRWLGTDGGARSLLGLGRDGPVPIDLVADGPHALVAGTTGSGKSELLRTLVVGLAANYPPDELSFLLIDYKGGAAFAEAVRLPHTTGVLTDLDAGLTGRALQSLEAELRRREGLLAVAGVDDLAAYRRRLRRHGGTTLARLVIVVDEFAELASDLPDFVPGLIGVARRGRSLGVHLVLATQRPGSVVSAEIRANTALRISLRVTEAVESTDVIGVPDAALLAPGLPGRAYARIGQQVVELQTARVVADPVVSHPVVEPLGAWCRPDVRAPATADATPDDELRRVVDLIAEAGRSVGSAEPHAPWLPPLPRCLALADLEDTELPEIPLGRLDRPADQRQPVFGLDRAGDTVLVVGQSRSGRTTTLLTAAVSATMLTPPSTLQLHVVDGSGPLADSVAGLPHLGTVVTRDSIELVPRLLDRLASRPRAVATLLLVDDWDLVTGGADDALAARWTEQLAAVVRTAGPDLTVLVAGGRPLLSPRFAGGFASRLLLPLADPNDYGLAGLPRSAVPELLTPGGGVRAPDFIAFRVAHAGSEPTVDAARAAVDGIARRWRSEPAATGVRLRTLPSRIPLDAVRLPSATDGVVLGLAGDSAAPCVVDLVGRRGRFLVAGPARSGRSTALMTAATGASRAGHAIVVVASPRSPLREHARTLGIEALDRIPDAPPRRPALLVIDDIDACDEALADTLAGWLRDPSLPVGAIAAGRTDELVTSYRALVAEVRRDRCGVLLRPGPLDGELLGVRLRPSVGESPPGRGMVVGDPRWGLPFTEADAVPIQLACP